MRTGEGIKPYYLSSSGVVPHSREELVRRPWDVTCGVLDGLTTLRDMQCRSHDILIYAEVLIVRGISSRKGRGRDSALKDRPSKMTRPCVISAMAVHFTYN
jgi:hypothetical protein